MGRLKKFTHAKIAEQLQRRADIPQYGAYLMRCKVAEDEIGVVLDIDCQAWKELQHLVRNYERQKAAAVTDGDSAAPSTQESTTVSQMKSAQPEHSTHDQQHPDMGRDSKKSTDQQQQQQQQQTVPPSTPTRTTTTKPRATTSNPSSHHMSSPRQPAPFKPLVLPRCPTANITALCTELFELKPGYTGSIFRDDFVPEKLASQTECLSPMHGLPPHIQLSSQISVSAVRKACLSDGIAFIPSCLRGLVWAILLDVDVSALAPVSQMNNPATVRPDDFDPSSATARLLKSGLSEEELQGDANNTSEPVSGLSVIKVDLHRTYPHVGIFAMPDIQQVMESLLIKTCRISDLEYKQGLNYLLATFMVVWMPLFSQFSTDDLSAPTSHPSSSSSQQQQQHQSTTSTTAPAPTSSEPTAPFSSSPQPSTNSPLDHQSSTTTTTTDAPVSSTTPLSSIAHDRHMQYQLQLEGQRNEQRYGETPELLIRHSSLIISSLCNLITKLLPNTYSDHEFGSLQCLFMFFRLLLQYHDPVLSYHLDRYEMTPEFYASPWFLTLHVTRTKDIAIILLLWDHLILYIRQDPMLHYFISLGLLIDQREHLLQQQDTTLPETLGKTCIRSPHHLYTLFLFACQLRINTPPSASRLLFTITTNTIGGQGQEIALLNQMLSLEVGADESLSQTMSTNSYSYQTTLNQLSASYNPHSTGSSNILANTATSTNFLSAQQANTPFLFIDCRDTWSYNRGHIAAAISFPLSHLDNPLLRHQLLRTIAGFQAMHICIIHDGIMEPGSESYGRVTPISWPYIAQHGSSSQHKSLTSLISFLIYEGIRYVSVVANGYVQIHRTALLLGVDLINHSEDRCPICLNPSKYDAILDNRMNTGGNTSSSSSSLSISTLQGNQKNVSLEEDNVASALLNPLAVNNQNTGGSFSSSTLGSFFTPRANNNTSVDQFTGQHLSSTSQQPQQQQQQGLFSSISRLFNYTAPSSTTTGTGGASNGGPVGTVSSGSSHPPIALEVASAHPIKNHPAHHPESFSAASSTSNSLVASTVSPSVLNDSYYTDENQGDLQLKQALSQTNNSANNSQKTMSASVAAMLQPNPDFSSLGSAPMPSSTSSQGTSILGLQSNTQQFAIDISASSCSTPEYILVPPSLLLAVTLSSLRDVSVCGRAFRQASSLVLLELISIALDSFEPSFVLHSGYPITGHEHCFTPTDENNHRKMILDRTSSELWAKGRIRTSTIGLNLTPAELEQQQLTARAAADPSSSLNQTRPSAPPPPFLSYMTQAQISLVGIVTPLTYTTTPNTASALPLSNTNLPSSNLNTSNDLGGTSTFSSGQIMYSFLSSTAQQLNNLAMLVPGCLEVYQSTPDDDNLDQEKATTASLVSSHRIASTVTHSQHDSWNVRPLLPLPSGIHNNFILLFLPVLSIDTASSVLATLRHFLVERGVNAQKIAILSITMSQEGYDVVQHGFKALLRQIEKQSVTSSSSSSSLSSSSIVTQSICIISSAICVQQPLNQQAHFLSNSFSKKHLYHSADEHADVFPSIAQFFARYLQSDKL